MPRHLRILLLYSPFLIRLSPPYPCPKLYKSEVLLLVMTSFCLKPILMMLTLCHFVSVGKNEGVFIGGMLFSVGFFDLLHGSHVAQS
ncbi:hypothetical protein BDP27DRAFT_1339950, partial [Rhodocollybia butyracea]